MRNREVTITVNIKQLEALEDLLTCWVLCPVHNRALGTEEERAVAQVKCKGCIEAIDKKKKRALMVEGRLWKEFLKEDEKVKI